MANIHDEHYSYIAEWYDERACLVRRYTLNFYLGDSSVEMYDIKNMRGFLKRSKIPGISSKDIYLGGIISVYGRQLALVEYADKYTRQVCSQHFERTAAVIYGDGVSRLGAILRRVEDSQLKIVNLRMVHVEDFPLNSQKFTGRAVCLEMRGEDAATRWREITEEFKLGLCRLDQIEALLAKSQGTARLENCTCAVIKPHAIKDGRLADIIGTIQGSDFEISAMQMFYLSKTNSAEFYEIYKGVLSQYSEMVDELSAGPCVVLEIGYPGVSDIVNMFRSFCGPYDPEIASHLRPNTLRAKYGRSVVENAIHCSDLSEDGVLENEYFFRILSH